MKPIALSIDDVRGLVLRAQQLAGAPPKTATAMLQHLGAVQLDTISVLARSHELVAYARLGATARVDVEAAYWGNAQAFEYYGHAACIMPVELWPSFAFRRRTQRARWQRRASIPAVDEVRAALQDGPVTATDVGGARRDASGWWNWSDAKRALEYLCYIGEAIVTTRRSWKRVYDLPERVIPHALLDDDSRDEACYNDLVGRTALALGVATRKDLGDYYRLAWGIVGAAPKPRVLIDQAIEANGLVQVEVEGWDAPAFADPRLLRARRAGAASRTTLLSPFDSLIWDRPRTLRLFGFDFMLEAYKPMAERLHGYFSMPLLACGRLVGRVDPAREGKTLVARRVVLDDIGAIEHVAAALQEAAAWVGCDGIRIEACVPRGIARPLRKLVR